MELDVTFDVGGDSFDASMESILRGEDGISPICQLERNENGVTLRITDKQGTKEAEIYDGSSFKPDETLSLKNGILSVNTADSAQQDNTLPITSAAVSKTVGNIEILLKTI